MGDGAALQDIRQVFPLAGAELGGPAAAMALQQPFIAMLIPGADPSVDARAIHLQALAIWPVVCPWTLSMMASKRKATRGALSVWATWRRTLIRWRVRALPRAKIGCMTEMHVVLLIRILIHRNGESLGKQKKTLPPENLKFRIYPDQ